MADDTPPSAAIPPHRLAHLDQTDALLGDLVRRINAGIDRELSGKAGAAHRAGTAVAASFAVMDVPTALSVGTLAVVRLAEARRALARAENLGPDCAAGKHHACRGEAWDHQADQETACTCICHEEATAA